jgi:maltose alpha-D-glucosyltransferase/alpha-amylase
VKPEESKQYFGRHGDGIQLMFNFWVNQRIFLALATGDARPLAKALRETQKIPAAAQWAHFLRNHDELDLGRLTEEERQAVFAKFGPEPRMQLYDRGIRRRLATMLGDRAHLELAYSLLFALPGTPVIRYGDEIGMGDDLGLDERDAVRTPMQWSAEPQGGFSTAERTVHPVIDDGVCGYRRVNVEAQRRDPQSLLNWTVRMIRLRKECPEIGWGEWRILPAGHAGVLAMRYEWKGTALLILHNFSHHPVEARVRVDVEGGDRLVDLMHEEESAADDGHVHRIVLEAYGYRWFRIRGLNYALERRRV